MRYTQVGAVSGWRFYECTDHGFPQDEPLYGFTVNGELDRHDRPKTGELYNSLEHAMVAAVGEKYTGKRGAGGTAVGTAADWFMRMIGADALTPDPEAPITLGKALKTAKGLAVTPIALADSVVRELEKSGRVLARPARD